jgi:hypothetical protein
MVETNDIFIPKTISDKYKICKGDNPFIEAAKSLKRIKTIKIWQDGIHLCIMQAIFTAAME